MRTRIGFCRAVAHLLCLWALCCGCAARARAQKLASDAAACGPRELLATSTVASATPNATLNATPVAASRSAGTAGTVATSVPDAIFNLPSLVAHDDTPSFRVSLKPFSLSRRSRVFDLMGGDAIFGAGRNMGFLPEEDWLADARQHWHRVTAPAAATGSFSSSFQSTYFGASDLFVTDTASTTQSFCTSRFSADSENRGNRLDEFVQWIRTTAQRFNALPYVNSLQNGNRPMRFRCNLNLRSPGSSSLGMTRYWRF